MDSAEILADRELRLELEETRRRLKEAEDTLTAIRAGQVDALVISGGNDEDEIRTILDMGSLGDSLFNQVHQPIFILDASNRIVRSNHPAQELCGRNPIGLTFAEAIELHPADEDYSEGPVDLLGNWIAEGRHVAAMDVFFDHPVTGTRFYLLDANIVMLSGEGYEGGIVTLMDITSRKIAEIQILVKSGQLRHQFDLLKTVSDNITEGLILIDEDGKIIFQNPAVLKLLGMDGDESIGLGSDLFDVFRIESDSGKIPFMVPNSPDKALQGHLTQVGKLRARDGGVTPVQFTFSPVKDGDEVRGNIVVVTDISERLASERLLRMSVEKQQQSQKMEAIGRLAGGIAHDFNNLLLAILGFTDLSFPLVEEGSPLQENLLEVKKAADKAAALTSQLLAYSRKQMMAPKVRRVNDTIADVRNMVGRLIGEQVRFEVELSPEDLWAKIDPSKLQQVLVNVVLNAKDAMPDGGTLSIRTKRLDVDAHDRSGIVGEFLRETEEGLPPGRYACIEIEDTGHGMSAEVLERLFEPFFTTKEFGKGSGLGLSTAFGIIRQHDGYMQVFSEVSRGTTFRVILPLSEDPSDDRNPLSPPTPVSPDGQGRVILLVEDEEVVRRLLTRVLKDNGYRVVEARNGEEALKVLPALGDDLALIVTDLIMDGMGGIELAERLIDIRPKTEILFMSGYSEDQHKLPLIGGEAPNFSAKPFRPVEFLAKVRAILETSTQRSK